MQASSRALKEEVHFESKAVTSVDWALYPIITFPEIPDVHIVLLNRPDDPVSARASPRLLPPPRQLPMQFLRQQARAYVRRPSRQSAFVPRLSADRVRRLPEA